MQGNDNALNRAKELAQSSAGQLLAEQLRRKDPQLLQQILSSAARGDFRQAQQDLTPLLQDPQLQELLRKLGR